MVRRFGCIRRRGTSAVAFSIKVYGPGVSDFSIAVIAVLDFGVGRDLGQIATHQRQVVLVVDFANTAYALQCILVTDMAAERVTRIGRVDDHATTVDDIDCLLDEARLRMRGMNFEILGHGCTG